MSTFLKDRPRLPINNEKLRIVANSHTIDSHVTYLAISIAILWVEESHLSSLGIQKLH